MPRGRSKASPRPKGLLEEMYKKIFDITDTEDRAPGLRASSMPICPNKYLYDYYNYLSRGFSKVDYCKDFYCGIGTSVHSAVQKWLPIANPGILMGNWECKYCGKWVKDENCYKGRRWVNFIVYNKVGPINCPKCKRRMEYSEFELVFPDGKITGHTDGLLLRLDKLPEKIINMIKDKSGLFVPEKVNALIKKGKTKIPALVLELKTTSKYQVVSLKEPKLEHRCQATVYASAFKRVLPTVFKLPSIQSEGYLVKYISRDAPQATSQDFIKIVDNDKLYLNMCKLANIFYGCIKNNNPKKLWSIKPCKKWPSLYPNCEFEDFCFKLSAKEYKDMFKKVKEALRRKK